MNDATLYEQHAAFEEGYELGMQRGRSLLHYYGFWLPMIAVFLVGLGVGLIL